MSGGGPEAAALAAKMSEAWLFFARTGNPNTKQLPQWPAYAPPERAAMIFENECRVESDPESETRRLWRRSSLERFK